MLDEISPDALLLGAEVSLVDYAMFYTPRREVYFQLVLVGMPCSIVSGYHEGEVCPISHGTKDLRGKPYPSKSWFEYQHKQAQSLYRTPVS